MVRQRKDGAGDSQQRQRPWDGAPLLRGPRVPPPAAPPCLAVLLASGVLRLGLREVVRPAQDLEEVRHRDSREAARRGGQDEHQPDHDGREVHAENTPDHQEERPRGERPEAGDDPAGHQDDRQPQVVYKARPGRGLVLRHRRDDGDVLAGVGRVQKAERTAGPPQGGRGHGEGDDGEGDHAHHRDGRGHKEPEGLLVRLPGQRPLEVLDERHAVHQRQNEEPREVLRGLHGVEPDDWQDHREHRAVDDEHGVPSVELPVELVNDQQREGVDGDQVDDEGVPAPRGDHVEVREGGRHPPEHRSGVDGLEVKVKRVGEREDGDGLVVVRPSDAPGDVRRDGGHKARRKEASAPALDLPDHEVGRDGGEGAEERADHDADVLDLHGVELERGFEEPVDPSRGQRESGVYRSAHHSAQRVPRPVIEEVPEGVHALLARQLRHPVIEVRVELVDHGLVFDDTEQPDRKSNRRDENEGDRLDRRRDPTLVLVARDLGLLLV
mmetsp:Transcript_7267/g.21792  ORF Transcript_7267/g.21792 Transcript_7267/m.21792 type:complete len:496 (+) Transcript_7267:1567-3054(+)